MENLTKQERRTKDCQERLLKYSRLLNENKQQIYQRRLSELQSRLAALIAKADPDYLEAISQCQREREREIANADINRQYATEMAEFMYESTKAQAYDDFEVCQQPVLGSMRLISLVRKEGFKG